ncbi:MAG TPA: ABC transporter ATP-binding protein [Candidatus Methylomirabilis sp.]|jgi:iron complex transport system ATP-binding protein|nr:ABC transporter ATP-binding protein [Candidatus Methylomirabilis sp.]
MRALEIRGLLHRYRDGMVLKGLDLTVEAGEVLGVFGPNSAGKTTLLRLLCGTLVPAAGEIQLFGRPLPEWPRRELARTVALVPQDAAVAFPYTVLEVVLMGRYPHGGGFGLPIPADLQAAEEALLRTDLIHLAATPVTELSGGERQRVMLARAFAQAPRLLLLDEPTAHLDLAHQAEVLACIAALNREAGLTVILVSHDLNVAPGLCHRALLLQAGEVLRLGGVKEVMDPVLLRSVYGEAIRVEEGPDGPRVFPAPPAP